MCKYVYNYVCLCVCVFCPLNQTSMTQPINNVNLDLMLCVGGKFSKNNKFSASNKYPEYYSTHQNNELNI